MIRDVDYEVARGCWRRSILYGLDQTLANRYPASVRVKSMMAIAATEDEARVLRLIHGTIESFKRVIKIARQASCVDHRFSLVETTSTNRQSTT